MSLSRASRWLCTGLIVMGGWGRGAIAKERMVVLDLVPGADVSAEVAVGLSEAVVASAARAGFYQVMSSREIQALVGAERQRQLTGCAESNECMTEIGAALGARFLLRGTVGRLGTTFQIALQLVDTRKAETVSRSVRTAPTLDELRTRVPYAVATAAGLPPPPAPSRIPAFAAFAAGGALAIGGGILGGLASLEDATLSREQDIAVEGALASRATYAAARDRLFLQKTGAVAALGAGAGLIALGVFLLPWDVAGEELSLVVGPSGFAIAGVFP